MVPIIMHENELIHQRALIDKVAEELLQKWVERLITLLEP